jgi:lysophospholipase L1-like esterase
VTSNCTPASGSTFTLGSTTVTCNATDNVGASAACTFSVTAKLNVALKGTTLLAFGDSMTAGEIWSASRVKTVIPSLSYPTKLDALLDARYSTQAVTVVNGGRSSEEVRDPDTRPRLNQLLVTYKPDAVLLLEGANDINTWFQGEGYITFDRLISELRELVQDSFARGAKVVFLAALPPQIPGRFRAGYAPFIPEINARIQTLASQTGAIFVDLYSSMLANRNLYIDNDDGLHPTAAGYQAIAAAFFDAIRNNFEMTVPLSAPGGRR